MAATATLTHWGVLRGLGPKEHRHGKMAQMARVHDPHEECLCHWKHFNELVKSRCGRVALGPEEVQRAHEQDSMAIIFMAEGKFPAVEKLVPRMQVAGFICHVIGSRHPLSAEISRHGLAAILRQPLAPAAASSKEQEGPTSGARETEAHGAAATDSADRPAPPPSRTPPAASPVAATSGILRDAAASSSVPSPHVVPPPPPPPAASVAAPASGAAEEDGGSKTTATPIGGIVSEKDSLPDSSVAPPRSRSRSPRAYQALPVLSQSPPPWASPSPGHATSVSASSTSVSISTPAALAAAPWRRATVPEVSRSSTQPPPKPPPPPARHATEQAMPYTQYGTASVSGVVAWGTDFMPSPGNFSPSSSMASSSVQPPLSDMPMWSASNMDYAKAPPIAALMDSTGGSTPSSRGPCVVRPKGPPPGALARTTPKAPTSSWEALNAAIPKAFVAAQAAALPSPWESQGFKEALQGFQGSSADPQPVPPAPAGEAHPDSWDTEVCDAASGLSGKASESNMAWQVHPDSWDTEVCGAANVLSGKASESNMAWQASKSSPSQWPISSESPGGQFAGLNSASSSSAFTSPADEWNSRPWGNAVSSSWSPRPWAASAPQEAPWPQQQQPPQGTWAPTDVSQSHPWSPVQQPSSGSWSAPLQPADAGWSADAWSQQW